MSEKVKLKIQHGTAEVIQTHKWELKNLLFLYLSQKYLMTLCHRHFIKTLQHFLQVAVYCTESTSAAASPLRGIN